MKDFPYIVILSNEGEPDYSNPMEINARSKNEAYSLFSQDVPPETIAGVYTIPEYQTILQKMMGGKREKNTNFSQVSQDQMLMDPAEKDGKRFLNDSIQAAFMAAKKDSAITESKKETVMIQDENAVNQVQIPAKEQSVIPKQEQIKSQAKYFMDDGIQFKIENGILFKKVWETVHTEEYQNDDGQVVKPEFQIIIKETGKKLNSSKYAVQQLKWKQVQVQPPSSLIP